MPWKPGTCARVVAACSLAVLGIIGPPGEQTLASAPSLPGALLDPAMTGAAALPRLRSLLVSHHAVMVAERYFRGARATTPANMKSASKAVISGLVGIAIDRQLITGVGAPIAPFFPDLLGVTADPVKRKITIEDLLTMRAGLESTSIRNYGAWVQSPNWVRFVLTRRLTGTPGVDMTYSTGRLPLALRHPDEGERRQHPRVCPEALARPLGITLTRGRRIRRASISAATRC